MRIEDEKYLAALVLALGVVVSFYFEGLAQFFVPYLLPSLFFVMVFSLLPYVSYEKSQITKLHPAVLPIVGLQQFVLPALTALIGLSLGIDGQLLFFVMVTMTSGSLFASPTLVHLMGLDQRMAVQTVVISTLLAPISIYFGFSLLPSGTLSFDFMTFGLRLFEFLVLPILILLGLRRLAVKWTAERARAITRLGVWGSVISLVIFCFALEAPVAAALKTDSALVMRYLAVSLFATLVISVIARTVLMRYGYSVAMTASVLASFRNIGLTFGLVGHVGGSDLAIYVGASQIPMFFAPLLFEFFFGRENRSKQAEEARENREMALDPVPPKESQSQTPDHEPTFSMPERRPEHTMASAVTTPSISTQSSKTSPMVATTAVAISEGLEVNSTTPAASPTPIEDMAPQEAAAPAPQTASLTQAEELANARALLERLEGAYAEQKQEQEQEKAAGGSVSKGAKYSLVCLAVLLLGIAAVWYGNKKFAPMLFDQEMIREVAETHIAGKNYGVFDLNINIRDLRNETIKRLPKTPEVGILGASHWQEAHTSLLSGVDLYNSHIHRDYYEDMMAMVEIYERHDRLPKNLIITIRDKLLTPVADRTDFLWLPGIKYYRDFAARNNYPAHGLLETLPTQTWRELVNFSLLKTHGLRHLTADVMPHPTEKKDFEGLDVLLPGGSILWSREHKRLFDQERARAEALSFAEASKNSPPKIDPKGVAHMEFLFQYLKDKGINVTLTHPQFNPIFWDEVKGTDYEVGLKKIEDLTQSWADKYGFGYVGGFRPHQVGCKAEQYIDAEHGDPACLGMLLMQYRMQDESFKLRGAL